MNQSLAQYADLLASRTAVTVTHTSDFEDEAECGNDECDFEGLVDFWEEDSETAAACCPKCDDRIEKYIGPDAD